MEGILAMLVYTEIPSTPGQEYMKVVQIRKIRVEGQNLKIRGMGRYKYAQRKSLGLGVKKGFHFSEISENIISTSPPSIIPEPVCSTG
jgi:hypothetical protein